jgi:hypothetical protein
MGIMINRVADVVERKSRSLFQRLTTTTALTADDVVTFDSVKRHLRQLGMEDDQTILDVLQGAVNEAEELTNRTLRQSVTSTGYFRGWSYSYPMPLPPLISVTSVKYYDSAEVQQTVTASDYEVQLSTRNQGRVAFRYDYSFPNLDSDREAPVEIVFVRGHSGDTVPPLIKTCIRLLAESVYDGDFAKRTEAMARLQPYVFRGLP